MSRDPHEDDLLRALCAVDERSPPPPGSPITPATLQARLARRRRRALLLSAAAVLCGVLLTAWWRPHDEQRAPTAAATASDFEREARALTARIDRLLAAFDAQRPQAPLPDARPPRDRLRLALAEARASGIAPRPTDTRETNTREDR